MEKSLFLDIDSLLNPLSGHEIAVGKDFRASVDPESPYLTLKDLRADARRSEREVASSDDPDLGPLSAALNQWGDICELADRTLREQSKDLEIACWYCEALVRTAGFSGLAQGLELLARLVETYWDEGLYPGEDEDGVESRIAPLAGLIGRGVAGSLVQPIKLLPLTDRQDGAAAALWTIELAFTPVRSESQEARDRQSEQVDAMIQAVVRSSPAFLKQIRADITASLDNLDRLMRAVDARTQLGGFASQVAEPLNAIAKLLDDRVGHLFIEAAGNDDEVVPDADGVTTTSAAGPKALNRREDALAQLGEVADFFERTEPQSLIGSSIREVVRRARLPINELIYELLPEDAQRREFLLRAGIRDASN
ncbi:type VI secretion system protein TssA [Phenylobacterium sp.]|uniref:type VI secretion system protein TssA n=1 Tax=Phenylobacterium sp. TaxID=1871053 RepID=UPI00286B9910|nr:type VI secretion system protein TssA [Phenylobacterium sp.]